MGKRPSRTGKRRGFAAPRIDDHPLLRVLIAEATRRGDTLVEMATQLGISYRRVAQWRSKEASVSTASREVFVAAGRYLGVPTAFVLCLAEAIQLEDLTVQDSDSDSARVERDIQRMKNDPRFAGFVPDELHGAELKVKQLVLFMYRELSGAARWPDDVYGMFEWMRVLQQAVARTLESEENLSGQR